MLQDRIKSEMFLDGSFNAVGLLAEGLLSADDLKAEFEGGVRRKAFCEFLGIGESTLSTWLQSGRIPRMAAISYVLLAAIRLLSKEMGRQKEPFVLKAPDAGFPFAVVIPSNDRTLGQIVAMAADYYVAQSFAAAKSNEVANSIEYAKELLAERSENEGDFFYEAASALERTALLLAQGKAGYAADEVVEDLV